MADALADEVDFFSIGTNDLIQYALAIDRGNRQVAYLYQALHPAVLRMIKHVADVARQRGVKLFMCGEMAGEPMYVPLLLGLGLDELSMNPQFIPGVKRMTRCLRVEDCRRFVEEALRKATAAEIIDLLESTYGRMLSEQFYCA
jgi:phosphotransferase system enzyme I (PtsI)